MFRARSVAGVTSLGGSLILSLLSCSTSSAPPPAHAPKYVAPSAPGLLVVGPPGLVLQPGRSAQLHARLVDSSGIDQPLQTVTWTSTDPTIVAVDAEGNATATAPGYAEITASDGQHGVQWLGVTVSGSPPSGPTGVTFDPPLMTLARGATASVKAIVTDAAGTEVSAPPALALTSSDRDIVDVGADGRVTANPTAQGIAVLRAEIASVKLAGSLTVLVPRFSSAGSPPPSGPAGKCDPNGLVVTGCSFANGGAPADLSYPGVTSGVLVTVLREHDPSCPGPAGPFVYQQQSPDTVTFRTSGVADIDANGLVRALAPGSTTYTASVDGVTCESFVVGVGVDVSGEWSVRCANGDVGSVALGTLRPTVVHGATWGGSTAVYAQSLTGTSCITNGDKTVCSGAGGGYTSGTGSSAIPDRLCAESAPCDAGHDLGDTPDIYLESSYLTTCAPSANKPLSSLVFGNDHVRVNACDFTRGGSSSCGGDAGTPPSTSSCDGTYTISVPQQPCGSGQGGGAFTETCTVVDNQATCPDLGSFPVGPNCTSTGQSQGACAQPETTTFSFAGGACQFGYALTVNGSCSCEGTVPCTVTKN